jgi:hypothetical protein
MNRQLAETQCPDTSGTVITEHSFIDGELDFEQISQAIMAEEAWGLIFSGCRIEPVEGGQQNMASFAGCDSAPHPPECRLLSDSSLIPPGFIAEWLGRMLVRGRVRQVVLYRRFVA